MELKLPKIHAKGLNSFLAEFPMADPYLFYGGKQAMKEGKIKIIPMTEGLENLRDILE